PRADRAGLWKPQIVGIAAFIFSEVTFFGALIVAYLEYRTRSPGPGPHDLDVPRTLLFSLFLFASSGTVYLAERRLARDDQRGFATWWLASIGLRSEEHTSELQSRGHLVCRLLLEKKK